MLSMRLVRQHLKSVDSTNSYAKANVAAFDPFAITVISADEQTKGRGRTGRQWVSMGVDDIKMTFTFRIQRDQICRAYQYSPLLSLVSKRALALHGIPINIKWPNDIIISGYKKIGGILCELESYGDSYWVALGIGINVNSIPEEIGVVRPAWPLSTIRHETGNIHGVKEIMDTLCNEFSDALTEFHMRGFGAFIEEYRKASLLLGKQITFKEGDKKLTGKVVGIEEDGRIMIQFPVSKDTMPPVVSVARAVGISNSSTTHPIYPLADILGGEIRGFLSGEVSSIELAEGETIEGFDDGP